MKFELGHIISLLKEGYKAKDVAKKLNISNSNLSYYLNKLKKDGILKYKGFGIWVVQTSLPTPSTTKQIRGHAFIWKIEFEKDIKWEKHLKESKIEYVLQSSGKVFRIFFLGKKVWLKKKGMIIYEPYDFWGLNSYEAKGKAVFNLDRLIKNIFFKLKIQELVYKFTTSREHFAIVKNELARQYNENGDKLYIKGEDGNNWLWIDFSNGINELENNNVNINKRVQDWWNDNKKHNFEITPTFLMESLKGLVQTQQMNADNIIKHQNVLDEMLKTLKEIRKSL